MLETLNENIKFLIVTGPANQFNKYIFNYLKNCKMDIKYLRNQKKMSDVYLQSDIAISAGGTSCYELAYFGTELLGAPPAVLYLSAYSKTIGSTSKDSQSGSTNVWKIAQHINRVPVVIQQLTIPYPNDVDYITTSKGVPMPSIMNIDVALLETHSPNSYEGFNFDSFKQGRLQGF